jgi:aryl-alcohol dehydrogenase-like predicted oxidoreductase
MPSKISYLHILLTHKIIP